MIARRTARRLSSTAVAFTLGFPVAALAQQVGPYDPLGVRAGSFLIFPSIHLGESYETNVNAEPHNEKDDFVTNIQPEVNVQSNFSRHQLGFTVGGDVGIYANESANDYQDAFVAGNGRLDITRQNYLNGEVTLARGHQSRDDPENNPNEDVRIYNRYGTQLSFTQMFNRLNFRLTGQVERTAYQEANQADRDQDTYNIYLRTGYFVSPRINTFVQGRYNIQNRDRKVDFDGLERNSQGWGADVGAAVDLTDLLVGEFSFGYRAQTYAESSFSENDGIGYNLGLTWTPTRLTTVQLNGNGDFRPTSSEGSGAESNFRSSVDLNVDHELMRNVHIGGNVGFIRDDFSGEHRVDDTVEVGATATYLLTRNFSIDAGYTFTNRWSDDSNEEFLDNIIRLGLTARL